MVWVDGGIEPIRWAVETEQFGEHRITLSLRTRVDGRYRFQRIRPDLGVTVADVDGVQDLTLTVDQKSVDAAAYHAP